MAAGRVSRVVTRVAVVLFAVALLAGGTLVGTSAAGVLPGPEPTVLDPGAYQLPPPVPEEPAIVLADVDASATVDAAALQQGLGALDASALGTISYTVLTLDGTVVAASDADTARTPASSWKVLTAMGALSAYGADHRFSTRVVSSTDGAVVIGGGDPYLTAEDTPAPGQATLQALADQTAEALTAAGRTQITLGYDDSLFAAPQWHPAWPGDYAGDVSPISALSVDPSGWGPDDTSADAASTFANLLALRGIQVTGVRSEKATSDAQTLGVVDSWPLGRIVREVLQWSDNFGAEVLFRHISAGSGGDGSIAGAQQAQTAWLQSVGLWSDSMVVSDGSGLSLSDHTTATVLASAVRTAYGNPAYLDVMEGLPVAGVTGTLGSRFDDANEASGRGVAHAKTGTHDHERSLTGFVETNSGAILVFSFILNDLDDHASGINWLDQAVAVLAAA